jgi:hypothetical protein
MRAQLPAAAAALRRAAPGVESLELLVSLQQQPDAEMFGQLFR